MFDFESSELFNKLEQESVIDIDNIIVKMIDILPDMYEDKILDNIGGRYPKKLLHLSDNVLNLIIQYVKNIDIYVAFCITYGNGNNYSIYLDICSDFTDEQSFEGIYRYTITPNILEKITTALTNSKLEFFVDFKNSNLLETFKDIFGEE